MSRGVVRVVPDAPWARPFTHPDAELLHVAADGRFFRLSRVDGSPWWLEEFSADGSEWIGSLLSSASIAECFEHLHALGGDPSW